MSDRPLPPWFQSPWRFLLLVLVLTGCSGLGDERDTYSTWQGLSQEALPPCTASGSVFAKSLTDSLGNPYPRPFDDWAPLFHSTVGRVIQAHVDGIAGKGEGYFSRIQCMVGDYKGMLTPSAELYTLAASLPYWKDSPEKLTSLSEADVGAVLLEFLRVYECAMREHMFFLPLQIESLQGYCCDGGIPTNPCLSSRQVECNTGGVYFATEAECTNYGCLHTSMEVPRLVKYMDDRSNRMQHEFSLARTALEQALVLIGGMGNVRPLAFELMCLERLSLDLRNVLGLTVDTAACLPRIWDARGSLHDPPPP